MKRTAAIALFGLLMLPSVGYLFFFLLPRTQARVEVRERLEEDIPEGELVLLKLPVELERSGDPSFRRFHKREFRYRGNMYDVVRQEIHGDTIWYYCLFDQKETELYARLDDLTGADWLPNPLKRRLAEQLNQPLQWQYFPAAAAWMPGWVSDREAPAFSYCFAIKTWLDRPDPPPPKV